MIASSHTLPVALGKLSPLTKPRLAVATHILINANTVLPSVDGIRKYYDGPLAVAQDFMVFNISKDKIVQRIGVGSGSPENVTYILNAGCGRNYSERLELWTIWPGAAQQYCRADLSLP